MSKNVVELWVGVFVAVGLAALAVLAFKVGNLSAGDVRDGYKVNARFLNIGGLSVKAPVEHGLPLFSGTQTPARDDSPRPARKKSAAEGRKQDDKGPSAGRKAVPTATVPHDQTPAIFSPQKGQLPRWTLFSVTVNPVLPISRRWQRGQ